MREIGMKRIGLWAIIVLFPALFILAQTGDEIIAVKVMSSVDKFHPGVSHKIAIEVKIEIPFHINSENPTEDYMVPTAIRFEHKEGMTFGQMEFPPPLIKTLGFSDIPLEVYEGTLVLFGSIKLDSDFMEDEVKVEGILEYQACDENACLAPDELSFSQMFPVADPKEEISPTNQELFAAQTVSPGAKAVTPVEGEASMESFDRKGLFLTFVLIFLGGLALNLTPCVYPLIPITISYFGGQAQGRKGGIVTHAILYVMGMAVTYSILGSVAALTGNLFGAALQNPLVLIGIATILVILALSMFNLYEFRLPSFLTNLAGGQKKGFWGTLFMGLTVGFVAAPCIGPFVLGLLTYVGEKGNVVLGFLMFFVLAMGLGIPFVFLAIFSGNIDRLPKSGSWMVWVRCIFGFILIAMAVYFLQPLFPSGLFFNLTLALVLFIGGIYMAWIEPTKLTGRGFALIRNLTGVLFFASALILASSGVQSHIDRTIARARLESRSSVMKQEIRWLAYSQERLDEALSISKPVMIDFYAEWCIPCKEMDISTFVESEVVEISRHFVMLKADLTTSRDPLTKRLRREYKVRGVPTYVFITPEGTEAEELRMVGFVKKEKLLKHMRAVLATSE